MTRTLCAAVLLACVAWSANAQMIMGAARAVDGDTLVVAGQRVRLHGIDAPEMKQICGDNACGAWSQNVLSMQVYDRIVSCQPLDHDRYGRIVATCGVPGIADLGQRMVETGNAVRYPQYDPEGRYLAAEAEAKRMRVGVWAGEFQMPWEWRKERGR